MRIHIASLGLLTLQTLFATAQQGSSNGGSSSSDQATVNPNYVALLNDSMWFYEAQRSGKLPANNRVPWRTDSGLHDGSDNNVDLVGGYYDAGDYLKFTLPLAHSLTLLSWGGIEWFDGYSRANMQNYLRDTIRWGTDWLIKAHPEPNVLYVQVGDGNVDNNYWGPDTGIPTPRPSYQINSTAPGTDVAAETAAAFASASYLFRNKLNDSAYADQLLSHAESVYNFAETSKWQLYTEAVPAANDLYGASSYQSQLVYGALWLYRATGNTTYRDKASSYYDKFNMATMPVTVMDWSDPTGSAYVLGSIVDSSNTKYSTGAKMFIDTLINPSAPNSPCTYTSGGMLWCDGSSNSNSLVPVQDTALLALLYSSVDSSKSKTYTEFALKQLDYLLGGNRMLTPYVCGVHMNSPHNPHHAGASGGNDISKIATSPPKEKNLLYGAIVGGPDKDDKFYDERDDYDQTEVALDYNAPFQGLVAYQLANGAGDPPYVSITTPRPDVSRSKGMAGWLIAVIVIVVLFVLAGIGYFAWRKCRARRNRNQPMAA